MIYLVAPPACGLPNAELSTPPLVIFVVPLMLLSGVFEKNCTV